MLEFARNASVLKLWQRSPLTPEHAILYILRMRIVFRTTACAPSSNMRTLFFLLLQYVFSQARPRVKLACSAWSMHRAGSCSLQASSCSVIRNQAGSMLCIRHQYWLNVVHHASIWINAVRHPSIMAQFGSLICIVASCMRNCDSMLCIHDSMLLVINI